MSGRCLYSADLRWLLALGALLVAACCGAVFVLVLPFAELIYRVLSRLVTRL